MKLANFVLSSSCPVVLHSFDVDVFKENAVLGNDALMKCQIPSLVADLLSVDSWQDSLGNDYPANVFGIKQFNAPFPALYMITPLVSKTPPPCSCRVDTK